MKRLKQVLLLIQEKKQTKNIKEMNYITILDFEAGRVFQYDMPERVIESMEYEEYLIELGHKLGNCEWMVHKNPQVITK